MRDSREHRARPRRSGGRGARRFVTVAVVAIAVTGVCVFRSAAEAATHTLALVDFAVRAPAAQAAEAAWLGSAVSELLQAKLQLFGGARVLERMRVRALLREAKVQSEAAADDPGKLAGILPADVLIAGSVSVDPKDPRRIRVQARAFDVQTSKIVSEATFSGTGDLGGLLKIAADLAKTLADGLKLAYTPEQLAYAEPAKIDSLRFFIEGDDHLTAGRHREAVVSFQQALEGNEGRYYAAAHRLQGEAYQALAKASAGDQERKVREEYLKKFKDDALAASGALYDLGQAFETNAMWAEAIGAYGDYIGAVGEAGERVLWRIDTRKLLEPTFPPGARGARHPNLGRVVLDGEERIHHVVCYSYNIGGKDFITSPALVTLDARTGDVVRRLPLSILLGAAAGEEPGPGGVIGASEGTIVLWGKSGVRQIVAAVGPEGEVLWRHDFGPVVARSELDARIIGKGLVVYHFSEQTTVVFAALDVGDGTMRSRLVLSEGGKSVVGEWDLDPVAARLRVTAGSYALEDGSFAPRGGRGGAAADPREDPRETGVPGLSYTSGEKGTRLFRDGGEARFVERFRTTWLRTFPVRAGEPILLEWYSKNRFVVVDTRQLSVTDLYRDYTGNVHLEAWSPALLLFRLARSSGPQDARFTLPLAGPGELYNLLDAATGEVAAKFTWPEVGSFQFLGRDLLVQTRELARLRVAARRDVVVTPVPEARLRIALCLFASGDADAAAREVAALEGVLPGEPRVSLLRMRLAARRGAHAEAASFGARTLASGGLDTAAAAEALAAVRVVHPQVRGQVAAPVRANLHLRALAGPGLVVCSLYDAPSTHLVVDTRQGTTVVLPTPELIDVGDDPQRTAVVYRGRELFGFARPPGAGGKDPASPAAGAVVVRVDVLTGARARSEPFPHGCEGRGFLPGVGVTALLSCASGTQELWRIDPENLRGERLSSPGTLYLGDGHAVIARPAGEPRGGKTAYTVLDRRSGALLLDGEIPSAGERLFDATADRDSLVLAFAGGAPGTAGGSARTWLRVASVPITTDGSRWDYRAGGVLGGNVVIDGESVSFPAFEGEVFPGKPPGSGGSEPFMIAPESLPLRRVSVGRRDGARRGDAELTLLPWNLPSRRRPYPVPLRTAEELTDLWWIREAFAPPGPRRILPGCSESVIAGGLAANEPLVDYWLPAPGRHPVGVEPGSPDDPWKTLVRFSDRNRNWFEPGALLVEGERVYESIGGGVLLVKDFAGGAGLDRLLGPSMENDPAAQQ